MITEIGKASKDGKDIWISNECFRNFFKTYDINSRIKNGDIEGKIAFIPDGGMECVASGYAEGFHQELRVGGDGASNLLDDYEGKKIKVYVEVIE